MGERGWFMWTPFCPKLYSHNLPLSLCVPLEDKEMIRVEICGNVLGGYVRDKDTALLGGGGGLDVFVCHPEHCLFPPLFYMVLP